MSDENVTWSKTTISLLLVVATALAVVVGKSFMMGATVQKAENEARLRDVKMLGEITALKQHINDKFENKAFVDNYQTQRIEKLEGLHGP